MLAFFLSVHPITNHLESSMPCSVVKSLHFLPTVTSTPLGELLTLYSPLPSAFITCTKLIIHEARESSLVPERVSDSSTSSETVDL